MKNKNIKKLALLCCSCLIGLNAMAQQQKRPNIILILTDDMGYGDISCFNGGDYVNTPNIDRMAAEGTKIMQYYSGSPICSPSRVSILTGMHPANWNFTTFLNDRQSNLEAEQANYLNVHAPSMAKIFKDGGYATGHFGKWHMGGGRDVLDAPNFDRYGFDEHISTYESPAPDPQITATDWIWSPQDSIKRWDRTKYFVDKTLDFLKRNKERPCFVNLWPDDMHTPWVPGAGTRHSGKFPMDPTEEKAFKMVLDTYDKQMGRLLDGLKELGMEENTILIFTSDNGPLPSFRGSRSAGLRGTKLSLYEGGIRMPFIIKWPGHVPMGKTDNSSVISATDLLPSLAAMAGIGLPPNYKGDGENRQGVFLGIPSERKGDIYWEYGRNSYGFNYPKQENYKSPNLAIRSGQWKLLVDYRKNNVELYNMEKDKFETQNVSGQHPSLVKDLKERLWTWRMYLPVLTPERMNPK
ncbi:MULTISPECIES: sulfatase [unclassified Arenibacter]|uniref:sulfatase family protein n=1 Tax=unclassified Arenibacter TaxID=2615047 RepID=UPI000E34B1C6|nr:MULTISPECIES: sulfatase-like hydrolase/transferase [unclassified Arenibacter]MCM4164650.1 N-acetylgalactosamine-6-sulfatase [Arenibacter sp. A80]RFT55873.1 N-acetylgalactosamine-6-sulfatase [Arenibacter sp. P308M17]